LLSSAGQATGPRFRHPKEITNPYLPLSSLKKDILEGTKKDKPVRVERTVKPGSKTFNLNSHDVEVMIVEDREFISGEIEEVTLDYLAQDDGTVYYLGEDVDNYKGGKVISHDGSWLYGKDTHQMGGAMPSRPRVRQKFKFEAVGKITEIASGQGKELVRQDRGEALRFRRGSG
jgi:hypothetical protein